MGLAACNTEQSALHPAGSDAVDLANLFWFMTIGGALVWCILMGAAIYAVVGKKRPRSERFADRFVFVGGVVFPTTGLAALLILGLALLPDWAEGDVPDLRVHVVAEQFWWRLDYEDADGMAIASANEVHLPVGATVEFVLTSTDVIHSFWIPTLGGKMDAIPGRSNVLRLRPEKAGVYRGVCAEFCGSSHALMAFPVVVHEPDDFAAWLAAQGQPATAAGAEAFLAAGCGACHVVRGISDAGSVGPDLTHFAGRRTIGAGTLPLTAANLADWLVAPAHIKPGVRMPSFATLPDDERQAIVDFLLELK
ncbi:cytochrome c oxidase subunit II [Devosia ginsengisoli]|uniref:Cytochrome aa3 subunit 2 n=2 Tax=Devosia ginsengisoli TaxID=400770 RepID=A0A5B8LXJ7_9HYPH|nr:cytochrome c oxidase subunit II [Devosia ginsengisoli]